MSGKSVLFPLFMDLSSRRIAVIGDCPDVCRYVLVLKDFAGQLTLFSNNPGTELKQLADAGKLIIHNRRCDREDLYQTDMVIAISQDEEENRELFAVCKCLGIPVCVPGDRMRCDFFFPDTVRTDGDRVTGSFSSPERKPTKTDRDAGKDTDAGAQKKSLDEEVQKAEKNAEVSHSIRIFTDGSARGNPDGPGGYAAVLEYADQGGMLHPKEICGAYEKTTNNRMELMAAIVGLEALTKPCTVELYSDSRYLCDAFNRKWIDSWVKNDWVKSDHKPVKNIDLWKRLLQAKKPHHVTFIWVKGHAGHPGNERCDQLATYAADHGPWQRDIPAST